MTSFMIGRILQTVGTLMIGIVALRVHRHVQRERRIDMLVSRQMAREQGYGWLAVIMIAVGFLLEIFNT